MNKLKDSMMVVDSNINTVEEMLKDNETRLSEIKRTAVKYCSRDEGKIENQQLVVNDLKSQLKMAKTIKKGLVLILEREEQKEKSHGNGSIQEMQNIITLIIPQEA
jgi:nitrate reductase NapAB chaperone NapD